MRRGPRAGSGGAALLAALGGALWVVACASPSPPRSAAPSPPRSTPAPPAPDYAEPSAWAALPETRDGADATPPGERDHQASARADVFFVHPTTYYERAWNAAHDDPRAARWVDEAVLPHQAAPFNGAGRVFAPRYRQATVWTFTTRHRDLAAAAMELAYADVVRAFDAWAARSEGRPVVIAAHSQGSYHALRLLAERFETDASMRARLVAAYLVGVPIPTDVFTRTLPHIPPCARADETGCVRTWNTVLAGIRPRRLSRRLPIHYPGEAWESVAGKPLTCTNPLGPFEGWAPRAAHRGAVLFVDPALRPIEPRVEPGLTRARCMDGVLEVERTVPFAYRRDPLALRGDLHVSDYPLFFLDVRHDAITRVDAWAPPRDE